VAIPIDVNGVIIQYPQTGDVGWGDQATQFAEEVASVLGKIGQSQAPVNDDIIVSPGNFSVTSGNLSVGGNTTIDGVTYLDDDTTANTPVLSFTGDTNTGIGRSATDTLDFITNGNSRFRIEPTGQIKAVYESQVGTDYNTQLDNGYLCRAWVNFNGTGTIAIRASGNVSSLVDNNVGMYSINFTNNLPDINYAVIGTAGNTTAVVGAFLESPVSSAPTTSSVSMAVVDHPGNIIDISYISIGIFR